jgi:hypothetical protein
MPMVDTVTWRVAQVDESTMQHRLRTAHVRPPDRTTTQSVVDLPRYPRLSGPTHVSLSGSAGHGHRAVSHGVARHLLYTQRDGATIQRGTDATDSKNEHHREIPYYWTFITQQHHTQLAMNRSGRDCTG